MTRKHKPQLLPYLLERDGEVVKVCYAPDPREGIVASFVRINEEFRARPVNLATAKRWQRKLDHEQTKTSAKKVSSRCAP